MSDIPALTEKIMDCLMDGYLGKHSDRRIADDIVKIVERERDALREKYRVFKEETVLLAEMYGAEIERLREALATCRELREYDRKALAALEDKP
jgi:hypothetical protein